MVNKKLKDILMLWPILILLIIAYLFLSRFSNLNNTESYNVVLGISLGIFMGFLADLSKKSIDGLLRKNKFENLAFKLLKQDAEEIYRIFELYKGIIGSKDKPGAPPGVENFLPPALGMKYWKKLTGRDEFLDLAAQSPFSEIFNDFWGYEKLNNLIELVKNESDKKLVKGEYMIALAISKEMIKTGEHEKFLKTFITEKEFVEFKEKLFKK